MILGSGIDIVQINRIREIIDQWGERFLFRTFTSQEIDYCSKKVNKFQHFAGKFASKEAISKALKMKWEKGLSWKDIEIQNNADGIAEPKLFGQAREIADNLKIRNINLSISHCQDYAVAMAVIT